MPNQFFIPADRFDQLLAEEAECIRVRREKAFGGGPPARQPEGASTTPAPSVTSSDVPLPDDLVGLALSGGGLRSAAYNLGFLQALSRHGLLRYVDYMCSVSGGGYVAGHVTAAASATQDFHDNAAEILGVDANQRLVPSQYRFRHLGKYLLNYASFLWRYVASTIATLLLFISILGIFASTVALVWRSHDLTIVREYYGLTGINQLAEQAQLSSEFLSAFIPSMLFFLIFLLLAMVRHLRFSPCAPAWLEDGGVADRPFRAAPDLFLWRHGALLLMGILLCLALLPSLVLYVFRASAEDNVVDTLASLGVILIGLAVAYGVGRAWLVVLRLFDGNGVHGALWIWLASLAISAAVFLGNGESKLLSSHVDSQVQSYWGWFFGGAALLSFIPVLAAGQLAKSGQQNSPRWKRAMFVGFVSAATFGLPLAFVHLAARENVSGYATHRTADLLVDDVLDWNSFLAIANQLEEKSHSDDVDREQPIELHGSKEAQSASDLQGSDSWRQYQNSPAVNPFLGTIHFIAIHLPGTQNVFDQLHAQAELRRRRETYLQELNRQLFYEQADSQLVSAALMRAVVEHSYPKDASPPLKYGSDERKSVEAYLKLRAASLDGQGETLPDLWNRATLHNGVDEVSQAYAHFQLTQTERATFNRLLLECLYPKIIRQRTMVSTSVVPPADQQYRITWLVLWCVVLGFALRVDYNRWSPFYAYYRERLTRHFVAVFRGGQAEQPLHKYEPWKNGGPFPLLLGSHFLFCRVRPQQLSSNETTTWPEDETLAADASVVHPFVFTPLHCGGPACGYQTTAHYCGEKITLADAMAISGSALTPFLVENVFFSALMAAFNLRIGQWLPRPAPVQGNPSLSTRGYQIAWELWQGTFNIKDYQRDWKLTLAADGGFHDFFGLEQLLLRRCRLIIVSDAGCNNGHFEFSALADVIRMAREKHGITILDLDNECPADLSQLRRDEKNRNVQPMHHICLRVAYPSADGGEPTYGLLVYAQMSLTGREPLDLQQFRNLHPNFPDEPVTNQFFDYKQVESYRQLGYQVGSIVCSQLPPFEVSAGRHYPPRAEIARGVVRGYLADYAAVKAERSNEEPSPCAVDAFAGSQNWCPAPPSLTVEDYVSRCISVYLASGREHVHVDTTRLIGKEKRLAMRLVKQAIALLSAHRRLTGFPLASPFVPGGRRLMIRALNIAFILHHARGNAEDAHLFVDRATPLPLAWLALSSLVFKQFGPETVAHYLRQVTGASHQSIGEITAALKKADIAMLTELVIAPPASAEPRRKARKKR